MRMRAVGSKPLIFVGISFLIVAMVYSSFSKSYGVFAATKGPIECDTLSSIGALIECCQTTTEDDGIEITWCALCENTKPPSNCSERYPQRDVAPPPSTTTSCPDPNAALDATGNCAPLTQTPGQPLTDQTPSPKSGSGNLLPEGVFGGPTTLPQQGETTDQGAAEPPATEETQPSIAEEEPVPVCQQGLEFNEDLGFCVPTECPEGQELDEGSGLCVLEQPEVAEEIPKQSEPEEQEQQSSEEEDSLEDGNNDSDDN